MLVLSNIVGGTRGGGGRGGGELTRIDSTQTFPEPKPMAKLVA